MSDLDPEWDNVDSETLSAIVVVWDRDVKRVILTTRAQENKVLTMTRVKQWLWAGDAVEAIRHERQQPRSKGKTRDEIIDYLYHDRLYHAGHPTIVEVAEVLDLRCLPAVEDIEYLQAQVSQLQAALVKISCSEAGDTDAVRAVRQIAIETLGGE